MSRPRSMPGRLCGALCRAAALRGLCGTAAAKSANEPNILVIFGDDIGITNVNPGRFSGARRWA